jgi:hypothetical protein
MALDWQNLIAIALVLAAVMYLAVRGWRQVARKKAAGCGACSTCPVAENGAGKQPLVQIEALPRKMTK